MTQQNDKEQYFCQQCLDVVSLSTTGRCEKCNADNVVSMAVIQQIALQTETKPELRPTSQYPSQRRSFDEVMQSHQWYHIKWGPFETVVPYTKASNLEEALRYAQSSFCEWFFVNSDEVFEMESKILNRKEFITWARKLWPFDESLNTEESAGYSQTAQA